jgi:hypothetical protein
VGTDADQINARRLERLQLLPEALGGIRVKIGWVAVENLACGV